MRHVRALRRQVWLVVVCVVVGVLAAGVVVARQRSVYRASMQILVGQNGGAFAPINGGQVDPFVQTASSLITSDVVAATVVRDLHLSLSPSQLLARLAVSTKPQNAVVGVTYDSGSRVEAVRVLREVGVVATRLFSPRAAAQSASSSPAGAQGAASAQAAAQNAAGSVSATIFDPAHLDPGRVSPRPGKTLGIAAVVGLLIGVAFALGRQALKPRMDGRDQAEEWFGAGVVGTLPRGLERTSPLEVWFGRRRVSEGLVRALAPLVGRLQARRAAGDGVVVVTGIGGAGGKSALVAHVGAALAAGGERVVCVEVDDRAPTVGGCLGLNGFDPYGLVDVVNGRVELGAAVRPVELEVPALSVGSSHPGGAAEPVLELLPAGLPGRGDGVTSEALLSVARALSSSGRYVIVDAPPLLLSPQTLALALASDTVLVVARPGATTKADAEAVRGLLASVEPRKVGVILAARRRWGLRRGLGRGRKRPPKRGRSRPPRRTPTRFWYVPAHRLGEAAPPGEAVERVATPGPPPVGED